MSKVSLLVLRSSNCSQAQDSCSKDTASLGGTTITLAVMQISSFLFLQLRQPIVAASNYTCRHINEFAITWRFLLILFLFPDGAVAFMPFCKFGHTLSRKRQRGRLASVALVITFVMPRPQSGNSGCRFPGRLSLKSSRSCHPGAPSERDSALFFDRASSIP